MAKYKKIFKIQHSGTGEFWNGVYWNDPDKLVYSDKGGEWRSRDGAENAILHYMKNDPRYHYGKPKSTSPRPLPPEWQIVEFELKPVEKAKHDLGDLEHNTHVRRELTSLDHTYGYFHDAMVKKGVMDQVEFIFKLKGEKQSWGGEYVSKQKIMEARAQLRLLGVKTRTFREFRGMFGMLNREQAMRARLTLEVAEAVDVRAIRQKAPPKRQAPVTTTSAPNTP